MPIAFEDEGNRPSRRPLLHKLRTVDLYGVNKYIRCMYVMWFVRLFDFLEMSMIVPSLQGLIETLGGSVQEYYLCLSIFVAALMVVRPLVGRYVDGHHSRLRSAYNMTLGTSVLSNIVYAMSPNWSQPAIVLVARGFAGMGSASEGLMFVYLNRVALAGERQEWVTKFAATRSIGYFCGPMIATGLSTAMAAAFPVAGQDPHAPIGPFALPGWFLAAGNVVMLVLINVTWQDPPEESLVARQLKKANPPAPVAGQAPQLPQNMTVNSFLLHWVAFVVMLGNFAGSFIGLGLEQLVSPTTAHLLGWDDHHPHLNGYVFSAIGMVLFVSQLVVLQFAKQRMEDRFLFLFGVTGMSLSLCAVVVCWRSIAVGHYWDPFGNAGDRSVFLVFTLPVLLVFAFMPLCMNCSVALFMRLANHALSGKIGVAQAVQLNFTSLAPLLAPLYELWLYNAKDEKAGKPPTQCLMGMLVLGLMITVVGFCAYDRWGSGGPKPGEAPKSQPAQGNAVAASDEDPDRKSSDSISHQVSYVSAQQEALRRAQNAGVS